MKKALISVHIGDIHFGAIEAERLYYELNEVFLKTINKLPRVDLCIIHGDFYDRILSLNDLNAYYSFKFWEKLKKKLRKKNCKYIRLIQGTKNHDNDQLDNLPLDDIIDIKVIRQACSEELYDGYKVLYLPEEYIKNPAEYYADLFNDHYQLIVGHGQFKETAFMNYDSEIQMEAAPTYDSDLLLSICDGPIIFGHIHNAVCFKKRVFYTGSFTRWKQGEYDPKGFLINLTNLEDPELFRIIPFINNLARKYETIDISKILLEKEAENCIDCIDKYITNNNIYKLRLKAKEKNNSIYMSRLASIQNYYMSNKSVSLDIDNIQLSEDVEENEAILSKYDYLFDNLPPEQKISKFIDDTFDYQLSPERINQLLTNDILSLLDNMTDNED